MAIYITPPQPLDGDSGGGGGEEVKPKTRRRRRAKGPDGRFLADCPSTPDINEAWVEIEEN